MTEKLTKIIDDVDVELSLLGTQLHLAERVCFMIDGMEELDNAKINELEALLDGLQKLITHIREPLQPYCL